jgi:hypothetical protein
MQVNANPHFNSMKKRRPSSSIELLAQIARALHPIVIIALYLWVRQNPGFQVGNWPKSVSAGRFSVADSGFSMPLPAALTVLARFCAADPRTHR